jgi:tetratricopeptide (TPR) repeat protein
MRYFIGRKKELEKFEQLLKGTKGELWAIQAGSGVGKSTLLRRFWQVLQEKQHPALFLNIEDLTVDNKLPKANDWLLLLARLSNIPHLQMTVDKIAGQFPEKLSEIKQLADILKPSMQQLGDSLKNEFWDKKVNELSVGDYIEIGKSTIAKPFVAAQQLFQSLKTKKQQAEQQFIKDNLELFLLQAFLEASKKHSVFLIDTFEHLLTNTPIAMQTLECDIDFATQKRHLNPKQQTFAQWLSNLLEMLKESGAIVIVAGRQLAHWRHQQEELPLFNEQEILEAAQNHSEILRKTCAKHPIETQHVLLKLSFEGNPLWLQVGLNLLADLLNEGQDITKLAQSNTELQACFERPKIQFVTDNIEHASCKLTLFNHVTRHVANFEEQGWKLALPRLLNDQILQCLFGDQWEDLKKLYINAGILPFKHSVFYRLHEEIRDLLLAYAKHKKWLETPQTREIHQQLAIYYQENTEKSNDEKELFFLESAYHHVFSSDRLDQLGFSSETFWDLFGKSLSFDPKEKWEIITSLSQQSDLQIQGLINDLNNELKYINEQLLDLNIITSFRENVGKGKYETHVTLFLVGFISNALGKKEKAIASYDKAIEFKPDYYWAWFSRGIVLNDLGRKEEAIASYDKAIEFKPDYYWAWFSRGIVLNDLGRKEEAIASYDKAIEFKPDFHEAWGNRGIVLKDLGRKEEAIASYDKAIEFKPDYHEAWYNRGIVLNDLGRKEEAIASYDKAIEFKHDKHEAWFSRGNALNDLGRKEEAIASYDKALEIQPDGSWIWNRRANAFEQLGKLEEAIASYDKAIEIQPDDHWAWLNRGNALNDLGRKEEAIASYDKAIEFKHDLHEAWGNRGVVLNNLGRKEEAIASYNKVLEFKPDDHEAWFNRGNAFYSLGKLEEAIASYNKVLEFKPDDHEAWFSRGNAFYSLGKLEEAIASYDKAIEFKPDFHEIWDSRGAMLFKLGKLEEAAKSFAKALEIQPNDLDTLSNDIELALVQNDLSRMEQRLTEVLPLLKPNTQHFVILLFLQWLAQLIESPQFIIDKIQQIEENTEIDWDFRDTQPAIDRLTPEQQHIARSFIDFFEKKIDFETLQQQLKK